MCWRHSTGQDGQKGGGALMLCLVCPQGKCLKSPKPSFGAVRENGGKGVKTKCIYQGLQPQQEMPAAFSEREGVGWEEGSFNVKILSTFSFF